MKRAFKTISVTATLALSGTAALAQGLADQKASIDVGGPSVVHDAAFGDAKVEVRIIPVFSTDLTLAIMRVSRMPQSARLRTIGAHIHTRACATDPAASGGHYLHATAPATRPLSGREVWLDVRVDELGRGSSVSLFDWTIPKGAAASVVIHNLPTDALTGGAGARLLCTNVPF